jgi:ComEC/Rec2-related protein
VASLRNLAPGLEKALSGSMFFTPSLVLALVTGSAIELVSSCMLEGGPGPAGVVMLALAAASAPLAYAGSLRVAAGPGAPFRERGIARALVLLALSAVLAVGSGARVHALLGGETPPEGSGRRSALVERVTEKRYHREVLARPEGLEGGAGEARGLVLARVTGGGPIAPGDRVLFSGAPLPARDPRCGPAAYRRALLLEGVRQVINLNGDAIAVSPGGGSVRERTRTRLAERCDALFNRETAAIVKAFYFGNQDYIDKITMNDFKRAGVLHVLSASGLHVAVVAAIPLFLLGLARVNRKTTVLAAAATVALYLYLTDMPVSLLRACLMFFLFAAQRVVDRRGNAYNALFLSAVAILALFPGDLYSLGFQLSFGATLGILMFHGPYRKTLSWLPRPLAGPLALTLSAQVLVLPVLLSQVGEVNLTGLISNIIVVPLMSLLLVASLAANALSLLTDAAAWAGRACDWIYFGGRWLVGGLSSLDGHFSVDSAGPALAAAFCLLLLPVLPRFAGKRAMSLSILTALVTAWLSLEAGAAPAALVTVVRHGQGTLLIVKEGLDVALIGPAPEKGLRPRVISEIMAGGCRQVSMVLPRPDYRAVEGYTSLARRLPVRRCFLGESFRIRGYTRRLFGLLERDGADLVIGDCSPAGNGVRGSLPARMCGLYELAGKGELRGNPAKKYAIRYLTLH